MRFEIIGKNVSVTPAMREQIEKKLSTLDKYLLIDPNTIARVVARVYPKGQKVEVTIPTKVGILRTEVVDDDFYAAVDRAIDKLEDQIRRQKTRLSRRHKENLAVAFAQEDEQNEEQQEVLVKTKAITADEMDLDDAILQMEMLQHNFFVFLDTETDSVNVVYKRNDNDYGLLETEH